MRVFHSHMIMYLSLVHSVPPCRCLCPIGPSPANHRRPHRRHGRVRPSAQFLLRPPYTRRWDSMPQRLYDTLVDTGFSPRQSDGELLVLACLTRHPRQMDPDSPAEPILRYSHLFFDHDTEVQPTSVLLPNDFFRDILRSAFARLPQPVPAERMDDTVHDHWCLLRSVPGGRPSSQLSPTQVGWGYEGMELWANRDEPQQPEILKWRRET